MNVIPSFSQRQGIIFDVQRFSVHDGPGIRTTVFFKGCPLRCPWCQNPESVRPQPEIAFYADRCRDTGDCEAVCPREAVQAGADRILRERCDACGQCAAACPYEALRVVGRAVAVDDLLEEVLRDLSFYRATGGGVTLSGGEATVQMDFMGDFARRCKARGVSVGLQTCGAFRWPTFAPHLPVFAFIHFDLKLMDAEEHRRLTGSANAVILENARRLAEAGAPVEFRAPMVPGITDTGENLHRMAAFLRELGRPSVQLLRYHAMGDAKRARLGDRTPPVGGGDGGRAAESLSRAAAFLRAEGLEVLA